jgi:hypothetical protein
MQRQRAGTVAADDLSHTAGHKGQTTGGGQTSLGRQGRGRRQRPEAGRGHDDNDRPALMAWVSRQGSVLLQATKDVTVKTVQKAADIAVHAGSKLERDSASRDRALTGYAQESVHHTQTADARGEVPANRAACLCALLQPSLRVLRGVSQCNLPGDVGFLQCLRNFRQQNAFEQAELILRAALDPAMTGRAKKGEFVTCFDHFDLLRTAIN